MRALARLVRQHRGQVLKSTAWGAHSASHALQLGSWRVTAWRHAHGMWPPDGEVPGCAERWRRGRACGRPQAHAAHAVLQVATENHDLLRASRPVRRRTARAAHTGLRVASHGATQTRHPCMLPLPACSVKDESPTSLSSSALGIRARLGDAQRLCTALRALRAAGRPGRATAPGCSGAGGRGCWQTRRSAAPRAARPSARPAAAAVAAGRRGPGRPAPAQTRSACAPAARRAAADVCAVM